MEHGGIINSSAFFPNLYFDDIVKYIHDIKNNYSDEEPEKGQFNDDDKYLNHRSHYFIKFFKSSAKRS